MNAREKLQRANVWCVHFVGKIIPYMVEVAYFFFFLSRHMTLPLFQEYVQSEIKKQQSETTSSPGDSVPLNSNFTPSTTISPFDASHKESTLAVLSLQAAEGLPAVITVIILGAVSDRTGRRKVLLWLPALGGLIYSLIYIMILYTGWTMDGLFMASAIRGLSGSMTAFFAGSTFFAINGVAKEKRSSRLAVQEFLNGLAYAIANMMVGYWVKSSGFLQPFWFTFILSAIAFLVSFFLVQEIKIETDNSTVDRYSSDNCCIDTFKPMVRFFRCRDRNLVMVWLAILAFQTYAIVHLGQINTLVLYLTGPPYNWESHKVGIFLSLIMGVAAVGTLVTPPVLRNWFSDVHITFAGLFSKAVGTLWLAVIQNETVLYFAILLLVLELIPFPMLRSVVANGISTTDQGSLFALMHCGESISYFLAPFMFQAIYAGTLHYFSGFVFVISVIILILPVLFVIGIKFLEMNKPVEYEPMEGETEMATENQRLPTDGEDISVIQLSEQTEHI